MLPLPTSSHPPKGWASKPHGNRLGDNDPDWNWFPSPVGIEPAASVVNHQPLLANGERALSVTQWTCCGSGLRRIEISDPFAFFAVRQLDIPCSEILVLTK
jgi:hypothetical protein